jgi:hypothetical protein
MRFDTTPDLASYTMRRRAHPCNMAEMMIKKEIRIYLYHNVACQDEDRMKTAGKRKYFL